MDSVSSYKEKLNSFRVKELKDVLTRLGLTKQGRRQDLVDRIIDSLSIEASKLQDLAKKNIIHKGEVAGIIDDAFRKLQSMEATSSSMTEENSSEINDLKPKEVVKNTIRCPCGSSLPIEPMIQCTDPKCGVLQHMSCVIIPEELSQEITPGPWQHYCETCRLNRADPFRVTVTHLLHPVKLTTSNISHDGSNPVQNVEKKFQLSKTDKNFLSHNDYNIQAWCILLNDKVQFRMQWPLYADLKVNGVPVRTVTRPGSQMLGANGRDDGSMIAFYMVDGLNQISLSGWDARSFCLGVRLVKENTVQQIFELILNGKDAESFEDALARVQRCIGGGMAMETEDSDSDLEVISDFVTVNLRCPMGGYRIKTAGRFRPCAHMGCFDLETFLQLNQRSRKWQCPICLKNYSLEDITIDPYLNRITKMVEDCDEDMTEIEVKFDGSWRVKKGGEFKNLDQWRLPDGRPSDSTTNPISNSAASMQLKREDINGNINHLENNYKGLIRTNNNSSSESHGDGEQKSILWKCNINNPIIGNSSASISGQDIIVLSDSDEDTPNLIYPDPVSKPREVNDVSAPKIPNSFTESTPYDICLTTSSGSFNYKDNPIYSSDSGEVSKSQQIYTNKVSNPSADPEYAITSSSPICDRVSTSNGTADHDKLVSPQGYDMNPPKSSSRIGAKRENLNSVGCGSSSDAANEAAINEGLLAKKRIRREQSNGPFSFSRRSRSARQRPTP